MASLNELIRKLRDKTDLDEKVISFVNKPRVSQPSPLQQAYRPQPINFNNTRNRIVSSVSNPQRAVENFNPIIGQTVRQFPTLRTNIGQAMQKVNVPSSGNPILDFPMKQFTSQTRDAGESLQRAGQGQFGSKGNRMQDFGNALAFLPMGGTAKVSNTAVKQSPKVVKRVMQLATKFKNGPEIKEALKGDKEAIRVFNTIFEDSTKPLNNWDDVWRVAHGQPAAKKGVPIVDDIAKNLNKSDDIRLTQDQKNRKVVNELNANRKVVEDFQTNPNPETFNTGEKLVRNAKGVLERVKTKTNELGITGPNSEKGFIDFGAEVGSKGKKTNPIVKNVSQSSNPIISQGKKVRGFSQTVIDNKKTPKIIKDFAKTQTYEPLRNPETMKAVSKIVSKGDSQAISFAKTDESVLGNGTAMVMMSKLIKQNRIDEAIDLMETVSPRFTKQGQQIQILSQFNKLTPAGSVRWAQSFIDKANKANPRLNLKLTPEKTKMIIARAKAIQKTKEGTRENIVATAELVRDIQEVVPPSIGQRLSVVQTMAMLLNPKTMIRNVVGNTIFAGMDNVSDVVGTGLDMGTSVFTGKRTKVLPSLIAQGKGYGKGIKEGTEDVMKGIDTSGGVTSKFDLPVRRTFTGKYNPLTYLEKTLGLVLKAPDRANFQAAYQGSLNNQMRAAKVAAPTDEMIEVAHHDGLYRTFQDNSKLAEGFVGLKRLMNKAGTPDGSFGLGDFLLKFPKTPANLLARGLDYSPAGFLKGMYEAGRPLITGQPFQQKAFVEALSRGLVGTGLISTGYLLAKNGIMTGRPEKDYDIAAMEREQGSGPFRFNVNAFKRYLSTGKEQVAEVGDNLVSFDWAQPISLPIAMGANMITNASGEDRLSAMMDQFDAGVSTLTEQPLVKGTTTFAKDVGREGPIKALQNAVLQAPAGFVPTLSNQIVQATDNTTKETYDPNAFKQSFNKVIARIPGAQATLPDKVGVLGQPQERYQNGSNNIFNVFFNPAFMSKISANPTAKEVLDIFDRSGETQQAPRIVDKKIDINGEKIALTPTQLGEYQTYVGQRADIAIQSVMNDPVYQQASDEDKAKFIGSILTDINSAAKIELFGNEPKTVDKNVKSILGGKYTTGGGGMSGVTLTKDGNLSMTDASGELKKPELTGNAELDKKLISAYNGQLTTRANDIIALYNAGKISAEEAEKELTKLKGMKLSGSGSGSGKKRTKLNLGKSTISTSKKNYITATPKAKLPKYKIVAYKPTKTKGNTYVTKNFTPKKIKIKFSKKPTLTA
jgi:hypothetical protein